MNLKQKRFVDEYLIDFNATQSAIRAGYSRQTAYSQGQRLLKHVEVKNEIEKRRKEKESELIATQDEVLRYFTSVLRGESESEVVVIEGDGDGCSSARKIKKKPDEKERLKAGENLAKFYGLNVAKVEGSIDLGVTIIKDDIPDEDD